MTMESLELGSASDIKAEAVPTIRNQHRRKRRCRQMPAVWALVVFAMAATIYFLVAVRETGSEEKTSSATEPLPTEISSTCGKGTVCTTTTTSSSSSSGQQEAAVDEGGTTNVCDALYECQTDRMGHETPLYTGQGLCNAEYRFGVTPDGVFQWHNCALQATKVIYDPISDGPQRPADDSRNSTFGAVSYFSMSPQGTLRLMDDQDQVIWQKESKVTISFTKQCLHNPLLDCPYLHLHKSGDVVLNSINDSKWSDRNIERAFDNLFHEQD